MTCCYWWRDSSDYKTGPGVHRHLQENAAESSSHRAPPTATLMASIPLHPLEIERGRRHRRHTESSMDRDVDAGHLHRSANDVVRAAQLRSVSQHLPCFCSHDVCPKRTATSSLTGSLVKTRHPGRTAMTGFPFSVLAPPRFPASTIQVQF